MKRMLSTLIVAVMMLTVVSVPQMTNADARGIKVIPYPRTAGKMASYKISFNVTRALEANKDSITVTLPKETVVPDYISSSVISINPKKLIGTDFRLNFSTGGITFTNPLREGDMIKASYTYEASEEYTFMPKATDVKFFDRCYGYAYGGAGSAPSCSTDNRNNNGQFDPGEWVYEDRDHNGRISPGDRRLTVVKGAIAYDAKQNSIVGPGDNDCAQDLNLSTYLNPLIPLSIIKLTMLDMNKDGIYNEGDYLFDDRDQSGSVSIGDNMIAGIAYFPAGTKVELTDPDNGNRLANRPSPTPITLSIYSFRDPLLPVGSAYRHSDDGKTVTAYDPGEAIYFDSPGTSTYMVDAGDIRLTAVTMIRNGNLMMYEAGSTVNNTDADSGTRIIDFKTATGEEEGFISEIGPYYNPGDPIYRNGNGRVNFFTVPSLPMPGDIRLSAWSFSAYEAGTPIQLNDADANQQLVAFNTNPTNKPETMVAWASLMQVQCAVNTLNSFYTSSSTYYTDSPTTNISDTWFPQANAVPVPTWPVTPSPLPATIPPLGTWLYRDMDNSGDVSIGDERLIQVTFPVGGTVIRYSAGSVVKAGELDINQRSFTTWPLGLVPLETNQTASNPTIRHTENIRINNMYDPNEYIYIDNNANNSVDVGDTRLVPTGVVSFGSKPIGTDNPLIGETLTRGWARIENKVIVPYAQAGTKTAALETTPITVLPTLIPPTPPTNLSATYLTLPGGNTPLTNSGTWYVRVSAVNMYGEGEPSEPMAINFPQNGSINSVKLSWRPIPFAVSYRIYKSKNDAYFPPSSLLAEVESPVCEYVDRGTTITEGGLPFPYKASFVTLWRTRGGTETELVEYNCADYELALDSGMIMFRRALRPYEIVLADYKYAPGKSSLGADGNPCKTVYYKDDHVYVDTQRGIGKIIHTPVVDPKIDPLNYCFRLWRAPNIDTNNPYLLRENSDYTINYQTGEITFSSHVVTEGDIITADYDTYEEVAGESLKEAISTGITQAQCSSPVIPESYTIFKAVALRSSPQIKITAGSYGSQIVFTTPVDVTVDPDNDVTTPDIVMTLNRPGRELSTINKGAVQNPPKAGNYQLWVSTSQEQTPIMSEPYEIIADKDLGSVKLNIISPQGTASGDTIESVATAGQPISVVAQLMAGSNGLPNIYVKFEIVSTPQPQSAFSSPSLVQTNDQGLATVALNLSATAGTTVVKVYLQDKPSLSWTIRINTGPATSIAKIVVTPSNIALTPNSQQQFTAQAFDANGTVIQGATFTWAADTGVINPNGLYTAPTNPGIVDKVYARSSGKEGYATVQITQRPQRIEVTPQSAIIAAGSKQQYNAQAYDSYGNPMNVTISWSVKAGTTGQVVGVIDGNGLFTANYGTTGDSVIEACCAGVCGTAKINVSDVSTTVSKVEIIPNTVTMTIGGTYQFTAKAYDSVGNEIKGAAFVWSVNPPTSGTITTTGLFIAAQQGVSVVSVQSGQAFASAVVNVVQVQRIDVTPSDVKLVQGGIQSFVALAYNTTGTPITGVTYTWEVQPSTLGTISNGLFIATGTPGSTGTVMAKAFGMTGVAKVTIEDADNEKPVITLVTPSTNSASVPQTSQYQIEFKVTDKSGLSEVTVNGIPVTMNANGNYTAIVQIAAGPNIITIRARDNSSSKNVAETTLTIIGSCPRILVVNVGSQQAALTEKCGSQTIVNLSAVTDIINNSTMVGFRDLGEKLFGGTVSYTTNADGKTVKDVSIQFTKTNGDMISITCVIGEKLALIKTVTATGTVSNDVITMPSAPIIVSATNKAGSSNIYKKNLGRTMIPMRTLVEALFGKEITVNGAKVNTVNWTSNSQPITFTIIP
ncbi:MAG: hypothetical protein KA140_02305 [Caldisericia bacterium]|nr:hypothetical protein [Caldisericia bacterium]